MLLLVALVLLRPSLLALKMVLYSPLGWVAMWLALVYGYLFLHPRKGPPAG